MDKSMGKKSEVSLKQEPSQKSVGEPIKEEKEEPIPDKDA